MIHTAASLIFTLLGRITRPKKSVLQPSPDVFFQDPLEWQGAVKFVTKKISRSQELRLRVYENKVERCIVERKKSGLTRRTLPPVTELSIEQVINATMTLIAPAPKESTAFNSSLSWNSTTVHKKSVHVSKILNYPFLGSSWGSGTPKVGGIKSAPDRKISGFFNHYRQVGTTFLVTLTDLVGDKHEIPVSHSHSLSTLSPKEWVGFQSTDSGWVIDRPKREA